MSTTPHRDYEADRIAEAALRERRIMPRLCAARESILEAMDDQRDEAKYRDLESLLFSVGVYIRNGQDVSEEGAQKIAARVAKLKAAIQ